VREIAAEMAHDLDSVLVRLTEFGIAIPGQSRLHEALGVLRAAEKDGMLAPVQRGDTLGLRAIELALDFRDIASALPAQKSAVLRRDLNQAVQGQLEPPDNARGPLQFQSQLVVRAALTRAGANPLHPPSKPNPGVPDPDILLENGLTRYGLEVKRPQSRKALQPRFLEGVDQIHGAGLQGGVVIDATDIVRGLTGDELDREIRSIALEIYDLVWEGHGRAYRPGFSHIMVIGTLARPAWTSQDGPSAAMVQVHTSSTVATIATAAGNLSAHRARWIRKSLQDGLNLLRLTSAEQ
jgi:hypothetical protein